MTEPMADFVVDLAISTAIGIVFGIVLSAAVSSRRAGIWGESAAIAVMAVVAGGFFSIDSAGGSGYLGAFLAGLIVGNMDRLGLAMHSHHERDMRVLIADRGRRDGDARLHHARRKPPLGRHRRPLWLRRSRSSPTLIFVARPLAVLVCLLADRRGRWTREEIVFLAWTRETGVVPAALAGIIVGFAFRTPSSSSRPSRSRSSSRSRCSRRRSAGSLAASDLLEPIAAVPDDAEIAA